MKPIRNVTIVGVGLIGGSLGLAWRKRRPDLRVTGFDEPDVLDAAHARGAIDDRAADLAAAVSEADLVVLAVPIVALLGMLERLASHLRPETVVTDVGSVKQPVAAHAREVLGSENPFVGGHPMAGSEHGGIEHADPLLFENATYVLCPPGGAKGDLSEEYAPLVDLVQATGARVLVLDPERHDRIAATVSHLPQLLAVTLMDLAAGANERDEAVLRLAAGGFRDMTRIASSPFDLWGDIFIANHGPVLDALGSFAAALQRMRHRVAAEDLDEVEEAFARARRAREAIPRDSKGFLHPLSDVYVYAEDRPGELLAITKTLFDRDINIKDIELLKIREGTGGAFRLGFSDEAMAGAAVDALQAAGYTAYRL